MNTINENNTLELEINALKMKRDALKNSFDHIHSEAEIPKILHELYILKRDLNKLTRMKRNQKALH